LTPLKVKIKHLLWSSERRRSVLYLLVVLLIVVAVFRVWFFKSTILTHGDWYYYPIASLEAFRLMYFHTWLSDKNFGRTIIDLGQAPTYAMYGALADWFGMGYQYGERVIHMVPAVVLAPLSSFLYLRLYVKRIAAIAAGTAVFCCNTYFLQLLTGDITLATAFAIAPLVLFFFIRYFREPTVKRAIPPALASFLMTSYEPRVMYVAMMAVVCYLPWYWFSKNQQTQRISAGRRLLIISFPFALFLLLNLYWLLGVYTSGGSSDQSILARGLFGAEFFKLQNALAIAQPFWTGHEPMSFVYHSIGLNEWIIPVAAILGFYLNRHRRSVYFFVLLVIVGILLAKQQSYPLTWLYPWLYSHIPGFNAFREGSKFYLLIALGYSGLVAMFIEKLGEAEKREKLYFTSTIILILAMTLNLKPFFTGEIETTTASRTMPADYISWNKFIEGVGGYSRTLWMPTSSRWADDLTNHPNVNAVELSQSVWEDFQSIDEPEKAATNSQQEKITGIFSTQVGRTLANSGSIRYVVVPIRDSSNDDDFFKDYGSDRQYFIDALAQIPWLKKVNVGAKNLVVFENTDYKPYASSVPQVYGLSGLSNLEPIYNFATSQISKQFQFVAESGSSKSGITGFTHLTDPFTNLSPEMVQSGELITKHQLSGQTLYANTNTSNFSYSITGYTFKLNSQMGQNIAINANPVTNPVKELSLGEVNLEKDREYFVAEGTELHPLALNQGSHNLGHSDSQVRLVSRPQGENLISDGDFAAGPWKSRVDDCNNFDSNPLISMKIVDRDDHKGKAIELGAFSHTACTAQTVEVNQGGEYALSFDYQGLSTQVVPYRVTYDDPRHTTQQQRIPVNDEGWHAYRHILKVPPGATKAEIQVEGQPDQTRQEYAKTRYSDLKLSSLRSDLQPQINSAPQYQKISIGNQATELSLIDQAANDKNLIPNGTLENGLWNRAVGDCDNYDDKPLIGISWDQSSSIRGQHSVQLRALRHTACTSTPEIPISEAESYLLSFDYQSPNSSEAEYLVEFDDPDLTTIEGKLPITSSNWQHFYKTIKAPFGATQISVTVYANPPAYGANYYVNRYGNFKLYHVPNVTGQMYLADDSKQLKTPAQVTFTPGGQTKKYVHIKRASTSFFFAMSEAYHDKWRLEMNNPKVTGLNSWLPWAHPDAVAKQEHFKLNDFENGWYVDVNKLCGQKNLCKRNSDGTYDMEMVAEFTPQRWLVAGGIVSATTLAICILFLIPGKRHTRRKTEPKDPLPVPKPSTNLVPKKPRKKIVRLG
jgi:hypothetical protein